MKNTGIIKSGLICVRRTSAQGSRGKNNKMDFIPVNDLEKILIKASAEVEARPEFYKQLKNSDVYVIGDSVISDENGVIKKDTDISIQMVEIEGKLYLAIFTSVEQLSRTISTETKYYKIKFNDLFNFIGNTEIVINPYLEYGKILNQNEVNGLRDGSIWKPQKTMIMRKDVQVMVGKPKNKPQQLIDVLKKYFQNQESVYCAYNVHYYNPETDEKAHTLICIRGLERQESIAAELGILCSNVEVPDPPVDVIFINPTEDFGAYICRTFKPFYTKRKRFLGLF